MDSNGEGEHPTAEASHIVPVIGERVTNPGPPSDSTRLYREAYFRDRLRRGLQNTRIQIPFPKDRRPHSEELTQIMSVRAEDVLATDLTAFWEKVPFPERSAWRMNFMDYGPYCLEGKTQAKDFE